MINFDFSFISEPQHPQQAVMPGDGLTSLLSGDQESPRGLEDSLRSVREERREEGGGRRNVDRGEEGGGRRYLRGQGQQHCLYSMLVCAFHVVSESDSRCTGSETTFHLLASVKLTALSHVYVALYFQSVVMFWVCSS